MEQEKKTLIAIVGPTASGKTSLSIRLAKKYNGEVVSADSMQIYNRYRKTYRTRNVRSTASFN